MIRDILEERFMKNKQEVFYEYLFSFVESNRISLTARVADCTEIDGFCNFLHSHQNNFVRCSETHVALNWGNVFFSYTDSPDLFQWSPKALEKDFFNKYFLHPGDKKTLLSSDVQTRAEYINSIYQSV